MKNDENLIKISRLIDDLNFIKGRIAWLVVNNVDFERKFVYNQLQSIIKYIENIANTINK